MKSLSNQKLVFSALCIALYIVVMICTQSFAFGQYQIRIATALYGLSAIFPFLILPFGLANVVSNTVMGGLGLPDIIGGFIVGIVQPVLLFWLSVVAAATGLSGQQLPLYRDSVFLYG